MPWQPTCGGLAAWAGQPEWLTHTLPVGIRATVPDAPASQPVARLWFVHLARVGTGETALTGGALVPKAVPFLGLELGAPLAQGPSGRMWRAVYRKQPVAVKARQLSAAGRCVARAWHGAGLLGWRDHSAGPVGLIGPRGGGPHRSARPGTGAAPGRSGRGAPAPGAADSVSSTGRAVS